jgi:hypothetical protein
MASKASERFVWAVDTGLRRIGRVAQTLVAWRVAGVKSRQRRWRTASTGTIEQQLGHDPSSGSLNDRDY